MKIGGSCTVAYQRNCYKIVCYHALKLHFCHFMYSQSYRFVPPINHYFKPMNSRLESRSHPVKFKIIYGF